MPRACRAQGLTLLIEGPQHWYGVNTLLLYHYQLSNGYGRNQANLNVLVKQQQQEKITCTPSVSNLRLPKSDPSVASSKAHEAFPVLRELLMHAVQCLQVILKYKKSQIRYLERTEKYDQSHTCEQMCRLISTMKLINCWPNPRWLASKTPEKLRSTLGFCS